MSDAKSIGGKLPIFSLELKRDFLEAESAQTCITWIADPRFMIIVATILTYPTSSPIALLG